MKTRNSYLLNFILTVGFTLFLSLPSMAQEDTAMERFDIETFNKNKDGNSWIYTLQDGTKVHEWENYDKGYQVETTPPHSAYTEKKLFNYDSHLIFKQLNFFSFATGKSQEYNAQGDLVKEYDQDKGFAFSINDLIQKMKNEYNVDIVDTRKVFTVYRGIDLFADQEIPIYGVYVYDFSGGRTDTTQTIAYLFHGGTGELLYRISADIEGSPDIMMEYQKLMERNKANP